jgi:ATP-binding cassette subfamily C protein
MLLPLLTVLGFGGPGGNPVTTVVVAFFNLLGLPLSPTSVALFLLALFMVSAVVFLSQAYFATRLQSAYVAHWQMRLFEALINADWPFLRRQRSGAIVSAIAGETARLGMAFYQANFIASSVAFLLVQLGIALIIAPAVSVAILLLAIVLFLVTQHLAHRATTLGRELTRANAGLHGTAAELIGALKLVKATAHEAEATRLLKRHVERIEFLGFTGAFDVQIVRAIFEYSSGAAVVFLLMAGPLFLGVEIGAVIIVVAMFVRLFPKVTAMRQCVQSISSMLPTYQTLQAMRAKADLAREENLASAPADTPHKPASIRFDHVRVVGDGGELILDDIDLELTPGSFVAVIGSTGAGKTTLIDCVLGLVDPARGEVHVDEQPMRAISRNAWRRGIGYLGQDPVLFVGTIRHNITWGRPNIDDAAATAALEAAGAGFVLRLPGGLNTPVAERGGSFSGGERQRIALARALVGNSRLLILDEATSALDFQTEDIVVRSLAALKGKVTILAVTHRPALIEAADVVVVLEAGRIVGVGAPQELLSHDMRYRRLMAEAAAPAALASPNG